MNSHDLIKSLSPLSAVYTANTHTQQAAEPHVEKLNQNLIKVLKLNFLRDMRHMITLQRQ